jgi:uncharacterized protein involved in exopolysaccharide biosynthesis
VSRPASAKDEFDDEIDLTLLVSRIWSGRWWVFASMVVFTAAFTAYALLAVPVYRAATVLIPANNDGNGLTSSLIGALGSLGGLSGLAGINTGSGSDTEEALAVLRSRQFTETFITENNLLPRLFADRWDEQRQDWKSGEQPPTLAEAYKHFDTRIRSIIQDSKTGLITLRIEWYDREQSAIWANELIERLNAEMRSRAIEKSKASVGYLEKELEATSVVGTREAINRLIEAQIQQRMLANVTPEFAVRTVDKALPPDANDPVKPQKALLVLGGALSGLAVGIVFVLVAGWLRLMRGRPPPA